MKKNFSHLDAQDRPQMVDVSSKMDTDRTAIARALVELPDDLVPHFKSGDLNTKKGPVFQTAILAGIMAVKKTSELIPLCHPLSLTKCHVDIHLNNSDLVEVICTAKVNGQTGVEMEALTGATVAALTIYDMCKGFSHDIVIREVQLLEKTGGKKDFKRVS
jgi:cyclic pyranopterin phosphate synthase